MSFLVMTAIVGTCALASFLAGLKISPLVVGLMAALLSVHVSAWMFAREHRRQLLPAESWSFALGSGLAFWFYDEFLKIAIAVLAPESMSARDITVAIVATIVDFALVWAIVRFTVPWAIQRYGYGEPVSRTPNKSLERGRDR